MTGKSRGDIHVRTAQQIIENARRKGATTAGEEHHDASGRDIPSSQSRQYDVAPDSKKQRRKGKVASTQNQQNAAGVDIPAAGPPKQHKSKTASASLQQQSAGGTAQNAGTGKRRKTAVGSSQMGQTGPSQVDVASRQSPSQNPNRPQRKRQPKSPNSR
jgi:hypothetical protein